MTLAGQVDIFVTEMFVVNYTLLVTSALCWLVLGRRVERNKKFGRKVASVGIMIPVICGTHFCGQGSNPVKIIKTVSFGKCPEGFCG